MYVCIYTVCIYLFIYVWMDGCVNVRTYFISICMYVCVNIRTYVRILLVYVYVCK